MSTHEAFPMVNRPYADTGQVRSHSAIKCSKCGDSDYVVANNGGIANRSFHNRGWSIGNKRSQDICPACRIDRLRKSSLVNGTSMDTNGVKAFDAAMEVVITDVIPVNPVMQEMLKPAMEKVIRAAVVPITPRDVPLWPMHVASHGGRGRRHTTTQGLMYRSYAVKNAVSYMRTHGVKHPVDGTDFRVIAVDDGTFAWVGIGVPTPPPVATPTPYKTRRRTLTTEKDQQPMATPDKIVPFAPALVSPAADPARAPTRSDRQEIASRLDTHYLQDAERYEGNWSDAKLATAAGLPRAWVTAVRLDMYGEYDRNEVDDKAVKEITEAIAQATRAEARLLDMAQEAERIGADLKALLAKLQG